MALDEALLLSDSPLPALRFYTWKPEALSLGYFQRWADVPETSRAPAVVRRLTGGGAIHHAGELTFAIAAPLADPLYRGSVRESYERVHGALAQAFAALGVRAALRADSRASSDRAQSAMCFHRANAIDLVWDGAKGVGSAQRRTRGRVLHHGSIKLERSALEPGIAVLSERAPGVKPAALAALVRETFGERFGLSFERAEPTRAEREHAEQRARHFTSHEFVRRR